ncbi:MAG: hypothetical protein IPI28_14550 [Candidatus Omnitrophica bacterium]|nr:hypothetical protein [Candidatus Omnitrophota bacterium]
MRFAEHGILVHAKQPQAMLEEVLQPGGDILLADRKVKVRGTASMVSTIFLDKINDTLCDCIGRKRGESGIGMLPVGGTRFSAS